MSACIEWSRSTAPELRDVLGRPCVGLWAIGSTEQHGPHLITGFDHLVAHEIVTRVGAELAPSVVVLPTLALGCSDHWKPFGCTLSISQATLASVLRDVSRSAGVASLGHLVIVNGHAGNVGAAMSAVAELFDDPCETEFVSYWDLIGPEAMSALLTSDNGVGHAGEFETGIAWSLEGTLRPGVVPASGESHVRPIGHIGVVGGIRLDPGVSNGVVGDAAAASAAAGAKLVDVACGGLRRHCLSLLKGAS